ncbi:hypothetical protein FCM35_KLT09428 [Carex littledalei]|uniref:Uncharacterized protein n=1 Tax=Carex littledalei TaxID=544730 RepID=A0A833RFZ7_9POAL|nr:hypothetical protein FCM35_KLT09428 [Carex littledalei]
MEEELEETSLRHRTAASRHHHHQRRRAKKPPPQTTNYDDVFGGPPRHAVPFSGIPDDYAEVFGSVSVSCSIPFVDLPMGQMDGWDCASGKNMNGVEDGEIFGRCDFSDFAVPYEELFGRGESDEGEIDMHFASATGRSSVKGRSGPQTIDPSAFIQEYSNEDSIPYLEDENFSVASDETPKEYNTSYNKSSRTRAHELLHTTASVPQPQTGFTFVIEQNNPLPEHLVVSEDTVTGESSVKPNPKSSLNSQSISSKEQVSHGVPFLDVADVNLLTRSANLPPPAPKTSINERQRINTLQKSVSVLNFSTEAEQPPLTQQEKPKTILKSDSLPQNFDFVPNLKLDRREKPKLKSRPKTFSKSESLPPGFRSELDAMKEAMEFAQARLKTAKELHEKKREGKITELPLKKNHVKEENLENSEGEKPRVLRSISLASNFSKSREFMKLQGGVATQGTRELEKSGKWRSDEEFHELTSIDQPTKERENKVGMTGTEPLVETNRESVQIDGLPSTEGLS